MVKEFQKEYWEGVHQRSMARLPIIASLAEMFDEHKLFTKYLDARGGTLFEVGCAPGRWLAYFAKHFKMRVAGIDYAPDALELTRANLASQGFEADLAVADFFATELPASQYDVVYSRGFIEHFPETQPVVDRLVSIARENGGFVVTTVPNFLGINGWLRKNMAPASFAGHLAISASRLAELHERAGVRTLFCGYCGSPRIIMVRDTAEGGITFGGRFQRGLQTVVNVAFKRTCRLAGSVPRSRLLSPTIIYIGRRLRA